MRNFASGRDYVTATLLNRGFCCLEKGVSLSYLSSLEKISLFLAILPTWFSDFPMMFSYLGEGNSVWSALWVD